MVRYLWWGGRVVYGGSLENCYPRKGIVGSNPTPTATSLCYTTGATERWLSGRKHHTANVVYGSNRIEGSNPSLSARMFWSKATHGLWGYRCSREIYSPIAPRGSQMRHHSFPAVASQPSPWMSLHDHADRIRSFLSHGKSERPYTSPCHLAHGCEPQ